jgi:WD40 repeat protein
VNIYRLVGKTFLIVTIVLFSSNSKAEQDALSGAATRPAIVPEDMRIGEIVFSPDGRRIAFSAFKKGAWYLFEGNKKGKAYDSVKMITFSSDGRRIAYSARRGSKEFLVVDGKEVRSYDWVCNPVFSPDGSIVVHEARLGKKFFVVMNGTESPHYDMSLIQPVFSPDSRYITYILIDSTYGKSINFVNDARSGEIITATSYEKIGSLVFSTDGQLFAYVAEQAGKQFVVVRGFPGAVHEASEGPSYDRVNNIVFSPDGRYLAYVADKGGKQFLVISDTAMKRQREIGGYEKISQHAFSPDGTNLLFGVQSGRKLWWKVEPVE